MAVKEGSAPGFLGALGHRGYRLLWIGAFVSSVGTWTQDVGLSWLIHSRYRDPALLGLRSFAAEAPLITFMLVGGAVADRISRRRILLTSNVIQMLGAVALLVLFALDRLGIGPILSLALLTGLAQSQSAPTYQATLTSLVPPSEIPSAVALNSLQFNLSRTIGPALAGMLLAVAGAGACFGANALSFGAILVVLFLIPFPALAAPAKESLRQSLRNGISHVFRSPALGAMTLLAFAGSCLAFPLITYLPVVAGESLGTGAAGYAGLLSALGVGAIVGALFTARRGRAEGRGRFLLLAFSVYAVVACLALAVRSQASAMALLAVAGSCLVVGNSTLSSLVQEHAPPELRGRVLSVYGVAFRGGSPLGGLLAGLLARHFGAPAVLTVYSLALLVLTVILLVRRSTLASL